MDDTSRPTRHVPVFGRDLGFAVVGLIVLALLGVATWFVVHDRPQPAAGTRFATDSYDIKAEHDQTLVFPWGSVEVKVSTPRSKLPHDLVRYDLHEDPEPPDGGHFVGVSWSITDRSTSDPSVVIAPFPRTKLSLVADGHSFPLQSKSVAAAPCSRSDCIDEDAAWVSVPGAGTDVQVAGEYAGVTQTVDLATGHRKAGVAAPLYDATATDDLQRSDCGAARAPAGWSASDASPTCTVALERTPYVPRLGWAKAGTTWIVVENGIDPPLFVQHRNAAGQRDSYTTVGPLKDVTFSLPGATQHGSGPLADPDADLTSSTPASSLVAFAAPISVHPKALTFSGAVDLEPRPFDEGSGPARGPLTVRLTWTVTL